MTGVSLLDSKSELCTSPNQVNCILQSIFLKCSYWVSDLQKFSVLGSRDLWKIWLQKQTEQKIFNAKYAEKNLPSYEYLN